MRQMKKVFKTLKERQEEIQNQQMQQKQQELEQQQAQAEAQIVAVQQAQEQKIANDNFQAELDRINKKEIALIAAEAKNMGPLSDVDSSGTPDVLEINKLATEQAKAARDYQGKMAEIQSKNKLAADKLAIEREKLQVDRENQANDLAIAKENTKGRSKKTK
jgi:hypothetical protein